MLCASAHFGPPPAHSYQQIAPVVKKFRLFPLKRMPNELENPTQDKQAKSIGPKRMKEDCRDAQHSGKHNHRDAKAVAEAIDGMRVAACVLRNPLFVGASTEHARIIDDVSLRSQ